MGRLTLFLGGQKSGKSRLAARRAAASGRPVVVVAPAVPRDPEFAARVARHRADRPAHWQTVETFDLAAALAAAGSGSFVLVDALDTWLAESLESSGMPVGDDLPDPHRRAELENELLDRLRDFAAAVAVRDCDVLMIAGQPGLGVHAGGPGARAYVDLHGLAVQALSEAADEVLLVVGGRVLPLAPDPPAATPVDLRSHGDRQVPSGTVDLAVNVEPGPPEWLRARLAEAVVDLAAYPDERPARAAIAARHGRAESECLAVNGAAEAFWLIAGRLRPRLAACVQPSFTEPEAALRAAGVPVVPVPRLEVDGWLLDPGRVPSGADLVLLGRPDNPTGALDPVETVERIARPGRTIVVDEAFAEFLDDASGLAGRSGLPGLVVVRSLTKLWGLAGLRVGYLVGPAPTVATLAGGRQPWSCNALALAAIEALADAEDERHARASDVAARREALVKLLEAVPGVRVWTSPANFLLVRGRVPDLRDRLLARGLAARRADTFPGLDDTYIRVAVRDSATNQLLVDAIRSILEGADE
ncbi:MAG TPA: Rv2231c family pyridoxal phosphate-dependent protein CobC [Jiangellaceae bacterium]|nr:Rv2231c family pyridoxal phosphate-dependent protein CobC [Jiangellaceae bacterium]